MVSHSHTNTHEFMGSQYYAALRCTALRCASGETTPCLISCATHQQTVGSLP
eukprot:NODE_3285_length_575_cov_82.720532_g2768_i0.p4 GENE.NODE_3285_length_575_cov_82.720532_g2768_i0~~NODE_3285_length_575_cov_82.720532_g2768_i0.p4  ORF type:complete len:52 (-),score=2.68 NODE_3285_length_575_cov_82.720532_g2768_i0:95-250(-)